MEKEFVFNDLNEEVTQKLSTYYSDVITALGEDVGREGLQKTPRRVAKAMQFLTSGYRQDPTKILLSARFHEDYIYWIFKIISKILQKEMLIS